MTECIIDLQEDALLEILLSVNVNDIVSFAMTSTVLKVVLSKPCFLNRIAIVHGLPLSETISQLFDYSKLTPETLMKCVIASEDVRVINRLIDNNGTMFNCRKVMGMAARGGHQDIIDSMLSLGADNYDHVMGMAARGGHQDIVNQMISRGANKYNWAMTNAARGGHRDIVNRMLELGADDYNCSMVEAARGGHQDIVNQMILRGAYKREWAMAEAARGGHQDIVNQMLLLGVNTYNWAMNSAIRGGHLEIVDQMLALSNTHR